MRTSESLALLRELGVTDPTASPTTIEGWHARTFIENVTEARANGFDVACVECGVGIYDESDEHESWCKQNDHE